MSFQNPPVGIQCFCARCFQVATQMNVQFWLDLKTIFMLVSKNVNNFNWNELVELLNMTNDHIEVGCFFIDCLSCMLWSLIWNKISLWTNILTVEFQISSFSNLCVQHVSQWPLVVACRLYEGISIMPFQQLAEKWIPTPNHRHQNHKNSSTILWSILKTINDVRHAFINNCEVVHLLLYMDNSSRISSFEMASNRRHTKNK